MMSTKQAVFVRSFPDQLGVPDADPTQEEIASRRFSLLSTYSYGLASKKDGSLSSANPFREREEDLETVLDTSVDAKPYDETGIRTYERACLKAGVTPASNCIRNLELSQTLNLSFYGLGAKGVMPVAMALVINSHVSTLLLAGNSMGVKGFSYIQKMMEENSSITELDVSSNSLKSEGMEAIVTMLRTNKTLTDLNVADNGFVDADSYALGKVVEGHSRLQKLNLSKNKFGDESAHVFGHMIAENTSLHELDLSWNHFMNKGGKDIARGVSENPTLKYLNVSWNGFDDDGATSMGTALGHNGVLLELDLSCNRIGPKGMLNLLKGFRSNDSLETLRVGKNNVNDDAAEAMFDLLIKIPNLALKLLDMSDIILSNQVEPKVEELKAQNEELEVVYGYTDSYGKRKLKSYDMTEEAIRIIQEYCAKLGMSMVDLFTKFDADGSMSVTHDEFREGLKDAKIPLTPYQIDQLIDDLDRDGDGEIDFSELVITTEEKTA
ncbi:leucine-rich repeat-containing protein 74A [Aplysia californica]|uniref:Leucine-rich repeat-containing protein 74A n=1 Tax=Aplysia californica TaxID=6500 RepID=A0ABM1W0D8_APLCA|nr:leucine-rich repeat-containing protein 74A [Aplysia californica]